MACGDIYSGSGIVVLLSGLILHLSIPSPSTSRVFVVVVLLLLISPPIWRHVGSKAAF